MNQKQIKEVEDRVIETDKMSLMIVLSCNELLI